MDDNKHQKGDDQPSSPNNEELNTKIETLAGDIKSVKSLLEEAANYEEPEPYSQQPARHRFDEQPPTSYEELLTEAEQRAVNRVKREEEVRQQEYQQNLAKTEQEKEALQKKWDEQEAQLEKAGHLPKINDPSDPEDAGRLARHELYKTALELGSSNLVAVYNKAIAPSKGTTRQKPAGSRAPVGGSSSVNTADNKSRDYRNTKRPIDDVRREYFPDLY